jgi:hypothetical protein
MTPGRFETRIFAGAASALVGEEVGEPRAELFLRDFGARAPWHVAWGLRALIWAAFAAPFLFAGRVRGLLSLPMEERSALWNRALEHRFYDVRQLALLFKTLVCLCWFDEDSPRMQTGRAA